MNGLVLGEENAVKMMDLNLGFGVYINIIPAKINKDGIVCQTFQSCKQARI